MEWSILGGANRSDFLLNDDGYIVGTLHSGVSAHVVEAVNAYAAQQERAEQVKALADALRPLAAIADAYPASHPNELKMLEFVLAGGERLRLTLGDARKAAAALKAVEGEEPAP